jgi:outer membrane lipoprotein carrier protein
MAVFVALGMSIGPEAAAAQAQSEETDASSGEALLEEVQRRYDALESMQATFTQTVASDFSNDSSRIRGRLLLKGSMYRVETSEQTLVTDGTTSWVYTPADSQVVVNDASQDPGTLSPETFFTNYAERYDVTTAREARRNGTSHTVLSLTPSSQSTAFQDAVLWVRRTDRVITRLQVTDRNGSTITIDLDDVRLDPALPDDRFHFEPPSGIDVVDLRSQ